MKAYVKNVPTSNFSPNHSLYNQCEIIGFFEEFGIVKYAEEIYENPEYNYIFYVQNVQTDRRKIETLLNSRKLEDGSRIIVKIRNELMDNLEMISFIKF